MPLDIDGFPLYASNLESDEALTAWVSKNFPGKNVSVCLHEGQPIRALKILDQVFDLAPSDCSAAQVTLLDFTTPHVLMVAALEDGVSKHLATVEWILKNAGSVRLFQQTEKILQEQFANQKKVATALDSIKVLVVTLRYTKLNLQDFYTRACNSTLPASEYVWLRDLTIDQQGRPLI